MNEITKQAVMEANRMSKSTAQKAAEGIERYTEFFHNHVKEAWSGIVFNQHIWEIRSRADHLFRLWHPECYEKFNEDEWYMADEDFDIFEFAPRVEKIFNRFIEQHPELQLHDDYDQLLYELHPRQLTMF